MRLCLTSPEAALKPARREERWLGCGRARAASTGQSAHTPRAGGHVALAGPCAALRGLESPLVPSTECAQPPAQLLPDTKFPPYLT